MPEKPPAAVEAEAAVLGGLLLNPDAAFDATDVLGNDSVMFTERGHAAVFTAALAVLRDGRPLDVVTLSEQLRADNQLDAVGGIAGLAALVDTVPTSSNVRHYAEQVRECYLKRRVAEVCRAVAEEAFKPGADPYVLIEQLEREGLAIAQARRADGIRDTAPLLTDVVASIERDIRDGVLPGLSTGFEDVDRLLSGLKGGEVTIVAARPSVGKTALALNVAHHAAVKLRKSVLVVSLEMAAGAIVKRLLCIDGNILGAEIDPRQARGDAAFQRLRDAEKRLRDACISIDDSRDTTSAQVRSRVRRHVARHPVDLIIVDYVQELHADGKWTGNRTEEVGQIVRDIRAMAQEADAPVLLLSQFNRLAADIEPQLHHLRSSGDLEQAADVVLLLHPQDGDNERLKVIVAKHRNGPTGECVLRFDKPTGRFYDENAFVDTPSTDAEWNMADDEDPFMAVPLRSNA